MKKSARAELTLEKVFGKEYFGEDGIWTWDVGDDQLLHGDIAAVKIVATNKEKEKQDEKDEETFDHVVQRHPLVIKWTKIVLEEAKRCGLDLKSLWPTQYQEASEE